MERWESSERKRNRKTVEEKREGLALNIRGKERQWIEEVWETVDEREIWEGNGWNRSGKAVDGRGR